MSPEPKPEPSAQPQQEPNSSQAQRDTTLGLSDRHAVVTGGTGALGTAVVARLLAAGAHCHVPVFDRDELARFPFRDHPQMTLREGVDLGDETAVRHYYQALPELWASIHCVGGFAMSAITDTPAAALEAQWRQNAVTCFLCCREAIRRLRRSGRGGRLVNVTARPALEPRAGAGMCAYTMAKSAVAALSQALAEEVAKEDIWINAVAPSILDTPANRAAMPDADARGWAGVGAVAETMVFLAAPANRVTRGGLVPVYGRT